MNVPSVEQQRQLAGTPEEMGVRSSMSVDGRITRGVTKPAIRDGQKGVREMYSHHLTGGGM